MPLKVLKMVLVPAILVFTASAWGMTLYPRVEVDFQHPVIVNSQTLYPGHYVFQEVRGPASPQVFRVTDSQGKAVTLTSIAIKTRVSSESFHCRPASRQGHRSGLAGDRRQVLPSQNMDPGTQPRLGIFDSRQRYSAGFRNE